MSRQRLSKDDVDLLVACATARDFIRTMMEVKSRQGQPFTYAKLSRLAGISSRSYTRDVITGTKRLNVSLVTKFTKAFGLTGDLRSFFDALAENEEEACRTSGRSPLQIERHLLNLRKRLSRRDKGTSVDGQAFSIEQLPVIYAALGELSGGASIEEISQRTGILATGLLPVLEKMVEMRLIRTNANRYYASEQHISLSGLKESEVFRRHFISCAESAVASVQQKLSSDEALFFCSSFSVRREKLADLKSDLRSLLLKYVDVCEDSAGDKVVSLTCAMH